MAVGPARRLRGAVASLAMATVIAACGSVSRSATFPAAATLPDSIGQPSCSNASNQVDLVVEPAPSRIYDVCVGFEGASIAASSVLAKSGVQFVTELKLFGQSLCQVIHIPANYLTCLPTGRMYWAIFAETVGGSWQQATNGLATTLYPDDELGLRYDSTFGSPESPESGPAPGASPPG